VADWQRFLRRIAKLRGGGQIDDASIWSEFCKLAGFSSRQEDLAFLTRLGENLGSSTHRALLAVAVARLLAPIEWPKAWEKAGRPLVDALNAFVVELDPSEAGTAVQMLELSVAEEGRDSARDFRTARRVVRAATRLLEKPCRRDELPLVAGMCNMGMGLAVRAFRETYEEQPQGLSSGVEVAWIQFNNTLRKYRAAISIMNDALGEALFREPISSRSEE
jgi:hypothetical protein